MTEQSFDEAFTEAAGIKAGDKPAPESVETEAPEAAGPEPEAASRPSESQAPKAGGFDPWAGLNDEQRKFFEAKDREKQDLEHRWKSDTGRVAALQRKINELQAKPTQDGPTKADLEAAASSQEGMAKFREEWPEIAGPMEAQLKAERQETVEQVRKEIESAIAPFRQQQEMGMLRNVHPDYEQVAGSNEFAGWLEKQSPDVIKQVNSDYASDVSSVLSLYKTEAKLNKLRSDKAFNDWLSDKPESVREFVNSRSAEKISAVLDLFETAQKTASTVAGIKNRRMAALEAAESLSGSPGATRPVAENDFEAAFQAAAARHIRK